MRGGYIPGSEVGFNYYPPTPACGPVACSLGLVVSMKVYKCFIVLVEGLQPITPACGLGLVVYARFMDGLQKGL